MGQSSSTTTQSSSTAPGAQAQPEVQGLLSNLQGLEGKTGLTPAMSGAISQLTAAGQAGNPYAGGTTGAVNNLLAGGGATSQVPAVQQNLSGYQSNLSPYLDPNYSTINSPAVQSALQTAASDVTNQVNGQFAAAGRSGSGMNQQTLARGITQAQAPIILNQANQDTATRIGAANSLYGAGNTTAGTIAGMNQTGVSNQNAGINNVGTALTNSTWGPKEAIAAQAMGQQIPASNLGLLAQIGVPLAQLYQTQNGTGTTQNNPSVLSDIGQGFGILGQGSSYNPNGTVSKAGSGLLGLLGI